MEHSEGDEQSQQQQQQPWGKLIRLGADEAEPHVLLLKREWTIGRKKGCDLSFPGNKLVSGDHCKIIVDEESGQVSLEDTRLLQSVKKQIILFCQLLTFHVWKVFYPKTKKTLQNILMYIQRRNFTLDILKGIIVKSLYQHTRMQKKMLFW